MLTFSVGFGLARYVLANPGDIAVLVAVLDLVMPHVISVMALAVAWRLAGRSKR